MLPSDYPIDPKLIEMCESLQRQAAAVDTTLTKSSHISYDQGQIRDLIYNAKIIQLLMGIEDHLRVLSAKERLSQNPMSMLNPDGPSS